jgi:hypothetical protein
MSRVSTLGNISPDDFKKGNRNFLNLSPNAGKINELPTTALIGTAGNSVDNFAFTSAMICQTSLMEILTSASSKSRNSAS